MISFIALIGVPTLVGAAYYLNPEPFERNQKLVSSCLVGYMIVAMVTSMIGGF